MAFVFLRRIWSQWLSNFLMFCDGIVLVCNLLQQATTGEMSWENLIKDQSIFSKVIILLILITSSHDSVWILLGENWCWSLLGLKGLRTQGFYPSCAHDVWHIHSIQMLNPIVNFA